MLDSAPLNKAPGQAREDIKLSPGSLIREAVVLSVPIGLARSSDSVTRLRAECDLPIAEREKEEDA